MRVRDYVRVTDAKLAVLIFLAGGVAGWFFMSVCVGIPAYDRSEMTPAVLWAAGHGLSFTQRGVVPAFDDFMERRTLHLDPKDLPSQMFLIPAYGDILVNNLIYLLYSYGIVWRLFGISWSSLNVLYALFYGAMAAVLYAIFRLGMGRLLSIAGTGLAMSSPLMLTVLAELRVYCKGPFILGTILAVGYLLTRRIRAGQILALSIVLGAAIGVGFGFRQDVLICVPPAFLAVVFLARGTTPFRIRTRVLSGVLFLIAFAIPALPVLTMLWNAGGSNSFHFLQGHTARGPSDMRTRRASYGPLGSSADLILHGDICVFNEWYPDRQVQALARARHALQSQLFVQGLTSLVINPVEAVPPFAAAKMVSLYEEGMVLGGLGLWSADSEEVGRRLIRHLLSTFPADFISRWYAACVHATRGLPGSSTGAYGEFRWVRSRATVQALLDEHLGRFGEYYALGALVLVGFRSTRLALVGLCIILYFCGYIGIDFEPRHAFHLEFIGIWLPAFCLARILGAARVLANATKRREVLSAMASLKWWLVPVRNIAVFLAVSVVVLATPLAAARLWQRGPVDALRQTYTNAQLEPIRFEERSDPNGSAYYRPMTVPGLERVLPARWLWKLAGIPPEPMPGLLVDYLVAEFEVPGNCPSPSINLLYDHVDRTWDFTDRYDLHAAPGSCSCRYFFPVYRYLLFDEPMPFKGFSVAPGMRLKNLYRVKNQEDFPVLMNLWLFEDPVPFRWYQAIPIFGTWV